MIPTEITEELVSRLAEAAGLKLSPARLPTLTEALRRIIGENAILESLDLGAFEPALVFQARWD
jgi:Asp-tRNA(Asn)/Glu-tRNA(Gln) amidotransferase C subunit